MFAAASSAKPVGGHILAHAYVQLFPSFLDPLLSYRLTPWIAQQLV